MRVPGTGERGLQSECEGVASRECRVVFGLFAPSGICMAKCGRPKGAKESEASKKRKAERKARKEAELRAKQAESDAPSAAAFMRHFGVPEAAIQRIV